MSSHTMTEKPFLRNCCTPGRSEQMPKTPGRDGIIHIVVSPLELMQRLATLVPRPRLYLIRFRGVLAAERQATGDCHPPTSGERQVSPMLLTFRMPRANGGSWPIPVSHRGPLPSCRPAQGKLPRSLPRAVVGVVSGYGPGRRILMQPPSTPSPDPTPGHRCGTARPLRLEMTALGRYPSVYMQRTRA